MSDALPTNAFSIDSLTLVTILLMALTTYLTRVLGFALVHNRTLNPKLMAVLENVPGCVLISVIAPSFVSDRPSDLLALMITLIAAMRLSLLPTVIIGVVSTGLLRQVL
ncbi:AzlD family protein [Litoribrevibacter euphylliae]|uniref:AzlD family protein n=1 Tax=Litoribrevibacter euphylliae TaxID=1834034 RepID=A0ABV7HH76_9GAMM